MAAANCPGWHGRRPRGFAYLGENVFLEAPSSGRNGPTSADYGRSTSVIKRGFPLATSGVGEIDGQQIVVRQSGPTPTSHEGASDAAGDLRNLQMSGDPGFVAAAEWLTTRIDATAPFRLTHAVTTQIGVIDPFGKNGEQGLPRYNGIDRLGFGYFAGANAGSLDRAFYSIGNGATGCWEDHAYFGAPGAPAFRVKGTCSGATLDGTIVFGPDGGNKISLQRDTAGSLLILDKANATKVTIRQDGTVVAPSVLLSGGVTVAALGTCSAATKGTLTMVTDAASPSYNATLTGGGTVAIPAFCNGTAWTAHYSVL